MTVTKAADRVIFLSLVTFSLLCALELHFALNPLGSILRRRLPRNGPSVMLLTKTKNMHWILAACQPSRMLPHLYFAPFDMFSLDRLFRNNCLSCEVFVTVAHLPVPSLSFVYCPVSAGHAPPSMGKCLGRSPPLPLQCRRKWQFQISNPSIKGNDTAWVGNPR